MKMRLGKRPSDLLDWCTCVYIVTAGQRISRFIETKYVQREIGERLREIGVPNKRDRRLWLNVKADGVSGVTKRQFIQILMESIRDGSYELPDGWDVTLEWRNKENAPMRSGPWTQEMRQSAKSSDGFDTAVTMWLRRKMQ